MRATVMEVSIDNFNHNIDEIQKYVGNKELMPVIKANGYGTYINKKIDVINRFNIVCVATISEGVELRKEGYKKDIFILNQPYIDEIDDIIENDLIIGISDIVFIKELINRNKEVRVHLEIETGMNRTGIKYDELDKFIELIKNSKLKVEGIYTHLSSADIDIEYTNRQLDIFSKAVNKIKKEFNIKYIHSNASNGLLNYKEGPTNLVRPGIIMYGFESFEGVNKLIDIKPICKLKTKIIFLKDVEKGESISYSRTYKANKKIKVATIPIGYADGLRRSLSNKGYVVVNNKKAPIIGNVCMDSCMIDVTGLDVSIGTDVYIWDNDNITLDDIANECNTINYEIMSTISYRVPRIFI